jgi:hypothetical protein
VVQRCRAETNRSFSKCILKLRINDLNESHEGLSSTESIKQIKLKLNSVACSPQTNYTDRPSGRRLLAKLMPTFADIH